ncbi:MAG: 4-hydroxy-tetrahydrodipicolinate synthase [Prevotellaceae bacterium]|jgi:4-hydroxy-tetrahydrodipicolinate synthase|nr:4-hydroxy-tetrahydrodipicolinate synthase [Prevotellaceae bacterium]
MNRISISGMGVALITPFKRDKSIDFDALGKVIEYVTAGGSDFLVVLGTTAETPTLNSQEKKEIVQFVAGKNTAKLPLIVGVGGNNTADVVKNVAGLYEEADAVLSVTPYYNKPSQKGMQEHFTAIADASSKPVVLYNVPGRTGVNITADTCLKLAEHKNIIAVKEASGNFNQLGYILRNKPDDFSVLSGDDGLTLMQIAMGIDGVISVAGNAFPEEFGKLVHLALKGNFTDARSIHLQMIDIIDLLFVEGNPVGVKTALAIKGLIENELRLPLVKGSDVLYEKLKKQVQL